MRLPDSLNSVVINENGDKFLDYSRIYAIGMNEIIYHDKIIKNLLERIEELENTCCCMIKKKGLDTDHH